MYCKLFKNVIYRKPIAHPLVHLIFVLSFRDKRPFNIT